MTLPTDHAERDLLLAREALERKTEELANSVLMMRATMDLGLTDWNTHATVGYLTN
jgi:hypothetical protein